VITFDLRHLALLAPRARESYREAFAIGAFRLAESGMLTHERRFAHFLAQVCHETNGLTLIVENMDYRAERLTQVWPSRFPTLESAEPFANKPRLLANKVYGGRMGNVEPDDGWRYIGRGLLQLTGRENYARIGQALGISLVAQPSFAASAEYSLRVALEIWRQAGCNTPADKNDIEQVTRRINGGRIGLADRKAWLVKAKAVLGVA
jgi:putative chitinase